MTNNQINHQNEYILLDENGPWKLLYYSPIYCKVATNKTIYKKDTGEAIGNTVYLHIINLDKNFNKLDSPIYENFEDLYEVK